MLYRLVLVVLCALVRAQADDSDQPDTFAGPRIVGGYKVEDRSQFPYQASIRLRNQHFCGGTILNENHVITAAHCCYDKEKKLLPVKSLSVVVGDLNIRKSSGSTVEKSVKYVFTHSNYNPRTVGNDIAILRIKSTFGKWNSRIQPLPLATLLPPSLSPCRVSGWGTLKYEDESIPSDLYAANIYTFDQDVCRAAYPRQIQQGMFCAGHFAGGVDSCQGDSGGPLEYNNTLIGIVSWGFECARAGAPGVYTNVSYYRDWISMQETRASSEMHVISALSIVTAFIVHLIQFD